MSEKISQAMQDYLKSIYELTQDAQPASTKALADRLGVRPASVTGMIQKLASFDPPLVEYQRYRGVLLTDEGEKEALQVIRHHRLLELFLQERLGYSWDEVHEEAERLEHAISEELEERLARELSDPAFDPHGKPIPNRDLQVPLKETIPLNQMRPGQVGWIQCIEDDDPELLRRLKRNGIVPQTRIKFLDYSRLDENLSFEIEGRAETTVLGLRTAGKISVRTLST